MDKSVGIEEVKARRIYYQSKSLNNFSFSPLTEMTHLYDIWQLLAAALPNALHTYKTGNVLSFSERRAGECPNKIIRRPSGC